jgi:hypothetical protein
MLKKYSIEYSPRFRKHSPSAPHDFFTDDPIVCEEFVQELLEAGMALHSIKHDGVELPRVDFDRIVKIAASGIAAKRICASLNIKTDEERHRFGFSA